MSTQLKQDFQLKSNPSVNSKFA